MGGSESRFVIHRPDSTYTHRYITQLPGHMKIGDATGFSDRNIDNQYQKIVIKCTGGLAALRFDMHPQNYLGLVDGQVFMLSAWNASTQFKVLILQKKNSAERDWHDLAEADCDLGYDSCREKSMLVALYHPATRSFVQHAEGFDGPQALPVPLKYSEGVMSAAERAQFASLLSGATWFLECVGTGIKANEMSAAPKVPYIEVGDPTFFGGYGLVEPSPAMVIFSNEKLVSHGKGVAVDRLEHFCFDAGRNGMFLL